MDSTFGTPQERAFYKFISTMIGLVVLCLAPLGTLVIGYKIALVLGFPEGGVGFTSVGGFLLGVTFPVLAINHLVQGYHSALSRMYRGFLTTELEREQESKSSKINQLRTAYDQLKNEQAELLLAKGQNHELGGWK